jgi:hypothetical protein
MREEVMRKLLATIGMGAALAAASHAHAVAIFDVDALANASQNAPLATVSVVAGQSLQIAADPSDLWNAGALPRWSNADGLATVPIGGLPVGGLIATGADDSGQPAGTTIGEDIFGLLLQDGFTAPFGALVGKIGSTYFNIGTSFSGPAPATGTLYLMYWDTAFLDNTESVRVSIHVPEPASLALLSLALGAMGFVRRGKRSNRH